MTEVAVAFTAWLCPGVVTILGIQIPLARFPESAKPLLAVVGICEARPSFELYDPARMREATARVRALGKPAQMYPVTDVTVGPPLVDWQTVANFKEAP